MTNNKIYFVANWKMYGDVKSVNNLNKVINLSKKKLYKNSVIVYCPPFTILDNFVNKFKKTRIYVGAQDCYSVNGFGAFTGNISAKQLLLDTPKKEMMEILIKLLIKKLKMLNQKI